MFQKIMLKNQDFCPKLAILATVAQGELILKKKNPKKLPTFTHGTRRAKGARSLIDARSSRLPSGNLSGLGMLNSCFGKSLGPQRTLHQAALGCTDWYWAILDRSGLYEIELNYTDNSTKFASFRPQNLPQQGFSIPRPSRLPLGFALGQFLGPRNAKFLLRQISWSSEDTSLGCTAQWSPCKLEVA